MIESELRLLDLLLHHPEFFTKAPATKTPDFDLYWSTEFSKRDLVELLIALEHLGVIRSKKGNAAAFSAFVAYAEQTLHLTLPNAYKIREEVLGRKTRNASFLDRLRSAFIEKSQK